MGGTATDCVVQKVQMGASPAVLAGTWHQAACQALRAGTRPFFNANQFELSLSAPTRPVGEGRLAGGRRHAAPASASCVMCDSGPGNCPVETKAGGRRSRRDAHIHGREEGTAAQ